MAFGTPKYTSGRKFTQYWSLSEKSGPIVGRIIPPINGNAADGIWNVWHACHFGYKVPMGRTTGGDEAKTRIELFECPLQMDWKTKVVKTPCPECAKIQQVKEEIEELKAVYKGQGKSEADIKELLKPKNGYLKAHNRDSKMYINFEKETGEIGVLMLSTTTFKDLLKPLLAEIEEKYGFDPLLAGVVFEFSASGEKLDKVDKVRYATVVEEVTGKDGKPRKSETIKCVEWTDAAVAKCEAEAIDLKNPDRYVTISQDQIKMLVNGSGDPDENADIFALSTKAERREKSARSPVKETPKPIVNKTETKVEVKMEPETADDEEAAALRALEAIKAKKAAAAAQKAEPKVEVKTEVKAAPVDVEGMSDEEFMRQIEGSEA